MHRFLGIGLMACGLVACAASERNGPPGFVAESGSSASVGGDGEDGAPTDMAGPCDPYAAAAAECGLAMECSLSALECVPSTGKGGAGESCAVQDENLLLDDCLPDLVCAFTAEAARCVQPCDPVEPGCDAEQSCVFFGDAAIAVCLDDCDLIFQDCGPQQACYPVGANPTHAACLPSVGSGTEGSPCDDETDCLQGTTCTSSGQHVLGCVDDAPRCCTPLCDGFNLPCGGANTTCVVLEIEGQPGAGFCGQ